MTSEYQLNNSNLEFWTNVIVTLASIVSINITMYLYQHRSCMWFNPSKKYRPSLFFYTEVFHIEGGNFNLLSYFKYMYAEPERNVNCQIFILPKSLRKYAERRVQLPMQQYSI